MKPEEAGDAAYVAKAIVLIVLGLLALDMFGRLTGKNEGLFFPAGDEKGAQYGPLDDCDKEFDGRGWSCS